VDPAAAACRYDVAEYGGVVVGLDVAIYRRADDTSTS